MNVDIELNMKAKMNSFLNQKCKKITRIFINKDFYSIFKNKVEESIAPNYYSIVKEPMCLTEVIKRLKSNYYDNLGKYVHDMNLIWSNAVYYNGEGSYVATMAQCGEYRFKKELQKLTTTKQDEHLYKLKKYSEQISFYTQYLQKELDHVPTKNDDKI